VRTLVDFLRLNRRRYPDQVAVVDETSRITYQELADRAYAVANGLKAVDVQPGDHVGLLSGNSIFYVETYLGILCAGAVPVHYNWRWAQPELIFGLNDSQAEVVVADSEFSTAAHDAHRTGETTRLRRIITEGPDFESFLGEPVEPPPASEMSSINSIIFTGGTTGFPKGVMLSEQTIVCNSLNEIIDTDMGHDDITLLIAPMFHAASLLCWFAPHLILGATSVLLRGFDERKVGQAVQAEGVTNGFLVPNMVRRLAAAGAFDDFDWSSYRRMYVGGATFRMPDKLAVRRALPDVRIYFQYGLTEGGPIVTRLRPEDMFREDIDGSIGREFLFSEVQLRALDSDKEVSAGEVGEITVRGPNVMSGYFDRPKETQAVLGDDGWLRTGDLASRNEDGYFFYHDRSKDMIKTGGENVYSAEVERVLYAHPDVSEAAVIGVPSVQWDEEVCAVIALRSGAEVDAVELQQWCRAQLAGYKIPKRIVFVGPNEIPVNDSGKIVKQRLRKLDLFQL
jgi:acyl-CoA synthetase (AMP-forming)/AMP-acid ligase II